MGSLQNQVRDFKGLARKPLCYRYTIPHKQLMLHRFLSKLCKWSRSYNCTGGFGPALVESPSKQPASNGFR
jgi:hypothetical protein